MPEPPVRTQVAAPPTISASRRFYWSVRRELWDYRSIYLAPLAGAALALLGFLIATIYLPDTLRAASALDPMERHELIEQPYTSAALLIMGAAFVVALYYCLDALYGERRDRSVLFWKSLPVSDVTTVLAKASIPLVVLPLLTFAITVVTQWIMLLFASVRLLGSDLSVVDLWRNLSLGRMWMMLLYHLVAIHSLWFAPIFCWLLLVSAWARRAPFVWAALPPLAIVIVEKIAFNSRHFRDLLGYRVNGPEAVATTGSMDSLTHVTLGQLVMHPDLWIGLAVSALFLAGAVRLRRIRGPV
jgi:ABC-2 type transport system permease protein